MLLVASSRDTLACVQGIASLRASELMTGIIVFEHVDFLGRSAHITEDVKDLMDFKGPATRCRERLAAACGLLQTHAWAGSA